MHIHLRRLSAGILKSLQGPLQGRDHAGGGAGEALGPPTLAD